MSLLDLARRSSGDLHRRIEATPLARAMAAGSVEREAYGRLMAATAEIHETVESGIAATEVPGLPAFRESRATAARADAELLLPYPPAGSFEVLGSWRDELEGTAPAAWAWIGSLYVLEGSRMGSRMLLKPIASAMGVEVEPGCGVDYHLRAVADSTRSWPALKLFLESAAPDPGESAAFARGVAATFEMMAELYTALSDSPCVAAA